MNWASPASREGAVPSLTERYAHILAMIDSIHSVMERRAAGSLNNDEHWPLALERMFEIIGVAASHIPAEAKRSDLRVDWKMVDDLDRRLADPSVRVEPELLLNAANRLEPLEAFARRMLS